jgi:hypothetical protein
MAFEHYLIVRNSDLYEYKGLTKSVLMTIALLIIDEPEEDERGKTKGQPDPDAGWCVAGQDYIAAALGMSPDGVSSAVNIIKQDGWLEVVTWRNRFGHTRNKYRIPVEKLEEMKRRAYKKDESGNFIRRKQPKKARNLPRGERGVFLTSRSDKASGPELPRNTGKPPVSHASATGETYESLSESTEDVGQPYGCSRATVASRHGDEKRHVTEPHGRTASCGEPCGTEPSSEGFSGFDQQVCSACGEKPTQSTYASLDTFGETQETSSLDPTQRTSSSGHQTQGDPCEPQGEDFSPSPVAELLPQPGTDDSLSSSPSARPPVPPPPAPKLPEAHYSHKWWDWESNSGKQYTSCEFCCCGRESPAAGRVCRPDSERKEEAHLWRLAQEARLETGVYEFSNDATSLSF